MLSSQILLKNRNTWIEFLCEPDRKSTVGKLESPTYPDNRCCLGHGCHILEVSRLERCLNGTKVITYGEDLQELRAPDELVDLVGLWNSDGSSSSGVRLNFEGIYYTNLTEMNDGRFDRDICPLTPQKIGEYLKSVIQGGVNTPFTSI